MKEKNNNNSSKRNTEVSLLKDSVSKPVTLKMSWFDMLGKEPKDFTGEQRLERWLKWQELVKEKADLETLEYWTDKSQCDGCIWLDRGNSFCRDMYLPITVNPILTMRTGIIGMACMGSGYEKGGQLELEFVRTEDDTENLPF